MRHMAMSNEKPFGPDFRNDSNLWFSVWRSISYSWEKHWAQRSENAPAWWLGNHAGLMFRFREIGGFADSYFHGNLVAGSGKLTPYGRKFSDEELEYRKERQEWRRKNPVNFCSPTEELLKADIKKLQDRVKRLREQIEMMAPEGWQSTEELEAYMVHVDNGGTRDDDESALCPGDLTEYLEREK